MLLIGHVPHRLKPQPQRLARPLESRSRDRRCLAIASTTSKLAPGSRPRRRRSTGRTPETIRPTDTQKIIRTGIHSACVDSRSRRRAAPLPRPSQYLVTTRAKWIPYMQQTATDRLLRRPEVQTLTGLARATIYRDMAIGRFPRPVKLGKRSVAWPKSVIDEWIEARKAEAGFGSGP